MAKANVAEIAKAAGVPVASVVKVLFGQADDLSDTERSYIQTAMQKLNQITMTPVEQPVQTVGIVVPGMIVQDAVGKIVQGITEAARERNYTVLFNIQNHHEKSDINQFMSQVGDGGLILITSPNLNVFVDLCREQYRPLVLIDYEGHADIGHALTIMVDNRKAIFNGVQHLLELGHEHIACITGQRTLSSSLERLQGYRDALEKAEIAFDPALVMEGDGTHRQAYLLTQELLTRDPRPTAIVAYNDFTAFGAIQAVTEAGLTVGREVSIIGFDDIEMAATVSPPLTTIRQPSHKMGAAAFHLLDNWLNGDTVATRHIKYKTELVIRESTGVPDVG